MVETAKSDTSKVKGVKGGVYAAPYKDGLLPLKKIFNNKSSVQITLARHYGGYNFGILSRMVEIAKTDFPEAGLEPDDIHVIALQGDRRKGMWGIEFNVPEGTRMPVEYEEEEFDFGIGGLR